MGHLQNERCFLKFLETPNTQLARQLLGPVEMNHQICLYRSVSCLLLVPRLHASIVLLQGKGDPLGSHQAAAWPSPWLTGPSVFHPLQTVKWQWCIDLCLCHCYTPYQESSQSEQKLNCFHIKFSFCSTAADAWCRKSAPAGKRRVVRPTGQQNLPSAPHHLFYASSSPCRAPRASPPNPRSIPWAAGRQHLPGRGWTGGQAQPQGHTPKPLSRAKHCHQPIHRLKRAHALTAHLEA